MVQAEVADRLAAGPGLEDLRRAEREGRLVRRRTPCRRDRAQRLLAGAQRRLRAGRLDPARPAARRPPPARRSSPSSTPPSPSAASRSAPRCAGWPGSAEVATAALESAGVDPTARGEVLTVEDFARIAEGLAAQARRPARASPVRASPSARPPRSTSTSASAASATTASTRSTPSTRRSGSTTTCRSAAADDAHPGDPRRRPHRPRRRTRRARQHRAARGPAAGRARRAPAPGAFEVAQGHPGRRRHGRRLGRRAPPPSSRCDRLLGARHLRRRPAGAGRRARQRHPVLPRRRYGAGRGPRRARRRPSTTTARGGGSPSRPPSACRRPRSTATSTRCAPTPPRSRPRPSRCWRRWRPASPYASRGRSTTTSRSRRSTCVPSSAT